MKAVLCRSLGPPDALAVEEVPSPRPGPRQVLVSVRAAGVNFPDTLVIQGKYQLKPELPFSPGSEFAGLVKEVGAEVTGLRPGERVLAFAGWGGFAEEALAEASNAVALPPEVSFPAAAAFAMAYGTSWHALRDRGRLQAGETLLVLGAAGGVGLAAVELGKLMGARVIAAAGSEAKLAACREQGADEVVSYADEGWREAVKRLTGGRGADVVYDPVGGALAEPALRLTAWEGRYLVVGFAGGDIPRIPLNLPLLKGNAVVGVFWGEFARRDPAASRENLDRLLGWLAQGRLRPRLARTYPLAGAAEALKAMLAREVIGKLVLLPGEPAGQP